MPAYDKEKVDRLKQILKWRPRGMTITDLAAKTEINRNLVAKYLDILLISGQVEMQVIGAAKVFFLSHRVPVSSMLEFSSDLVIILDSALIILQVNEPFLVHIHEKKEALVGRNIKDIDHPFISAIPVLSPSKDTDPTCHQAREFECISEGMQHYYKIKQLQTAFEDGSQGITLIIEDITAQVTYQKMLELNEAKYRGIVEDQTEFITRFLPDGTLVFANDAYARYLGKKKEDLLGGPHIPDIDPDSIAGLTQCIQSLDIGNPVQSCECSIHHPCGKNRSILWTIRAFFDDNQKPIEFQGIGRDNTEKHEAATRINQYIRDLEFLSRKAQEFVELSSEADIFNTIGQGLSELVPCAVIIVDSYDQQSESLTVRTVFSDTDRQILSTCVGQDCEGFRISLRTVPAPLKTFALSLIMEGKLFHTDENLYNFLFQQVPADICNCIKETLNLGDRYYGIGLVRHGILFGVVILLLRKGETLTKSSLIETFIRQGSVVLHRRLFEDSLKKSEARYRGIIEDQTEFITRFLPDGTLIFVNDAYTRYLGKKKEDLIGGPHIPEIDGDDITTVNQHIRSLDIQNPVRSFECRIHHSCGQVRSNQWTVRAIFDDTQNLVEYQGVGRDTTEKREAAKKISQYIRDWEFLSRKSQEFVELSSEADIFSILCQGLSELLPNAVITVNSYDSLSGIITNRAVSSERDHQILSSCIGHEYLGFQFPLQKVPASLRTLALNELMKGTLFHTDESLYNFLFQQVPADICDKIKENLNLGDRYYGTGIVRHGILFGVVTFALRKGDMISNTSLIETYIHQASVVLHRRIFEDALRKSESRYRGIVEDQTEFITRFLPDGVLTFVNDSVCRYFQKERHELLGRSIFSLIPEEDKDHLVQNLYSLNAQNPVQTIEHHVTYPTGSIRWTRWTNRALFDDSGTIIEYQGVGRDITEQKEADAKIRQYIADIEFLSNKAYEFLELTPDADIYGTICRGVKDILPKSIVLINSIDLEKESATTQNLLGDEERVVFSALMGEDIVGKVVKLPKNELGDIAIKIVTSGKIVRVPGNLFIATQKQVPEEVCAKIEETLNIGDIFIIGLVSQSIILANVVIMLPKGEIIERVDLVEAYIRQAANALLRCKTEQTLRKSESRYRGIVEDQTEFVVRFLQDGTLTFLNDSMCRIFLKDRNELLGHSLFSLIPADAQPQIIQDLQSLDAKNPVQTVEYRIIDPLSRIRWIQWTNRALIDNNGTIIEYQSVGRDITEQKEAEFKIRQYIAEREFLMQTAMSFMELKDDENFYQYIADQILAIVPGQVIAVASIQQDERTITLESIAGLDAAVIEEFRKLGVSLFGKAFSLDKDPSVEATLQMKYLTEGPRLHHLLFREFPEEICTHLENLMGFGKSYVMGFIHEGKIFGSVIIILHPGQELKNKETLELFLNQVSIALLHNHARQELKAREKLYRSVLENIQDVFYRSDKEGNLIMASGGWAKMFGYDSLEECIGCNIAEKFYFEPERRKEVLDAIYRNGSVSDYEIVLKSRDGNPVYISTTSHLYYSDAGELLGLEGILHDISERHAAAEKLRNNLSQIEFFSRKIQEFIELPLDSDIYYAIGQGLKELLPDSTIIVNTYDRNTGMLTIKALIGDKARATALKHLQSDLTGVSFQIGELIPENIPEGKIYPVQKNFYSVLSRNFSQDISTAIMQELNLGNFYYLSLVWKGSFLGNVAFGLPKGEQLEKTVFIELYGKAASLALQRKIAEDSLKGSSCTLPPGSSSLLTGEEHALLKHAENASPDTIVPVPVPDTTGKYSHDQEKIKIPGIADQLHLNNALKMARDYIAILDLAGNCLWANDAMVSALDTGDYRELAGRNLALYIAPEFRKTALTSLMEAKKKGHKTVPLMLFSSSGRVPVEVNLSAIHAEDGNISGFLAIARNTDQKNAEKNK